MDPQTRNPKPYALNFQPESASQVQLTPSPADPDRSRLQNVAKAKAPPAQALAEAASSAAPPTFSMGMAIPPPPNFSVPVRGRDVPRRQSRAKVEAHGAKMALATRGKTTASKAKTEHGADGMMILGAASGGRVGETGAATTETQSTARLA